MKGFTTERKNLGRAITMQILRFEFSDLPDCPAEKGGSCSNVIYCNVTLCLTQQNTLVPGHLRARARVTSWIRDSNIPYMASNTPYIQYITLYNHVVLYSHVWCNHMILCRYFHTKMYY